MMRIRRSADRGTVDHGWLLAKHSFSFGGYVDPSHMGFGLLRVINEDRIQPGRGFGTHGHRDMEIFTYIIDGALEHRDSMGNGSVIRRGDIQRMSAGTGVEHSEFNPSNDDATHLLQIWILPSARGLAPGYEEKAISVDEQRNTLLLLVSQEGRGGSLSIQQDVDIFGARLDRGAGLQHACHERQQWLQVVKGDLTINNLSLSAGDGVAVDDESELQVAATSDAEFLLFDMARA